MSVSKYMRFLLCCTLGLLLIYACLFSINAEDFEHDGYIVKLSMPLSVMEPLGDGSDSLIEEVEYIEDTYVIYDTAIIDELSKEGMVLFAEPNYILEPLGKTPNDTYFSSQWTLPTIKYPVLYEGSYNGEGVTVAVIDSGLDIAHPDFLDADISSFSKNFLGDGTHTEEYYRDQLGHGTFVTSQIAAVVDNAEGIVGIADGAELMILRCISKNNSQKFIYDAAYDSGSGTVSVVSSAIRYAVDNGADVINISLGMTSSSTFLDEAINYAHSNGVIVVAAVGNSGSTKMYYPANCENVIGVGSVSLNLVGNLVKSSFSQYNTSVDVAAPGGSVLGIQIYPSADGVWYTSASETYLYDGGTSYASPVVAAIAAVLKQINPELDGEDLLSLIAVTSMDLGTAGYDTSFGYGVIDAERFIAALTEDEYEIQYVLNDSEIEPASLPDNCDYSYTLDANFETSLPVPSREGYAFKGWSFDVNSSDENFYILPSGTLGNFTAEIVDGEIVGYTIQPVTLHANWEFCGSVIYGDANSDGQLSLLDIIRILKQAAGNDVQLNFVAADCDGDGKITVRDVLSALQRLLDKS